MRQTGSDEILTERMADLEYVDPADDGMSLPRKTAYFLAFWFVLIGIIFFAGLIWTLVRWYIVPITLVMIAVWQIQAGLKDKWFWE